jgi:UDP-N-acetylmuramate dehydrogenase
MEAAAERNFGGWEKLAGIPGSIGGAIRGNAGAFGSEIKDFVIRVVALHTSTMRQQVFVAPRLSFSYRNSYFKQHPELIITGVTVELAFVRTEESKRLMAETIAEREKRHLQNVAAAGSFFMNPSAPPQVIEMFEKEKKVKSREGRVPAGWLIEKVGLKGARIGGAEASEQHPNYLKNIGNATAQNVLQLAAEIKEEVKKQFDIELHEEAAVLHN